MSKLNGKRKLPVRHNMTIDLDGFDLATEQGFGTGVELVTLEFLQGGKRVFIHVDLFQDELKSGPTLRLNAVNKTRDTNCTIQVKPWSKREDDQ